MTDLFKNGVITFDKSLRLQMLDLVGITTDKIGFLIFKNNGDYIKKDGNPIHIDNFAGVMKGKSGELEVITSDIGSLIEITDKLKGE
jgi:hypothetical protein